MRALVIGVGGAAIMKSRRRKWNAQEEATDRVFESFDGSDEFREIDSPLAEISGGEFEKLCDRLFAGNGNEWTSYGMGGESRAQCTSVKETSEMPVQAQQTAPTMLSRRTSTITLMQPSSRCLWFCTLASFLIGIGLLAMALIRTGAEERSQGGAVKATAVGTVTSTAPDTTYLSGQGIAGERKGNYLTCEIRDLPVAILADNPETDGNLGFDFSQLDPSELRILNLRMVKPHGGLLHIDCLELAELLVEDKVTVGSSLLLDSSELARLKIILRQRPDLVLVDWVK